MIESREIQIGIYRRDPAAHWRVDDIDIGSLVRQLTEEPRDFSKVLEGGSIKIEVQRTHEFEIIIALAVIGGAVFLNATLEELGKRFGGWLADQTAKLGTQRNPEVRSQGLTTVIISPSAMTQVSADITKLITHAAQAGIRVQLIIEPGH